MTAPARLSLFAALLIAVFAGAVLLGGAIEPSGSGADDGDVSDGDERTAEHGADRRGDTQTSAGALPGLAVAQDGYRLALQRTTYQRGAGPRRLAFRILDNRGRPVRNFDVAHEKRMHFIVVRRDFEDFQHLHPRMGDDGTWTQNVRFAGGGSYRVFADFTRDGEQRTLGADVEVKGSFQAESLRRPQRTVVSDGGLEVELRADAASRGDGHLSFQVRDHGVVVNDRLEPYLGAKGHLVALRQGDLAYLHTHSEGDQLAFETTYPTAGTYRLFVQFSYEGRVHTAAFTQRVFE